MTEDELKKLAAEANARYEALSPEQKTAHDQAQKESWVRGEMGFPEPKFKIVDGVKVYESYEDYCNG